MDFNDKALTKNIIGCAFKIHSTLGKGFLKYERKIFNVIIRFIQFILNHPVNPVSVFLEKATP